MYKYLLIVTFAAVLFISATTAQAEAINPDDASLSANLKLWLKADNIVNGAEPTVGSEVTSWYDSSGNSKNADDDKGALFRPTVQSVTADGMTYRVVRFDDGGGTDGQGDRLDAANLLGGGNFEDVTIMVRYKTSAGEDQGRERPVGLGSGDVDGFSTAKVRINLATDPSIRFDGANITYSATHPTDWFTRTMTRSGDVFAEYYDGTQALAPTTMTGLGNIVDDFYLGELVYPFDVDIAEVIVYNKALSTSERQGVEEYLDNKYVPEPSTFVLLGMGALALLFVMRRRRK